LLFKHFLLNIKKSSLSLWILPILFSAGYKVVVHSQTITNSIGIRMVRIPAGSFEMGNPNPKIDGWDETPVRTVTISQHFFMSETEVTIEQFKAYQSNYQGLPDETQYATGVSWFEAVKFCKWLSKREGKTYRLPTEAEWEYSARAGRVMPYWPGENPSAASESHPWGLKNMCSGPREWCFDWYGPVPANAQVDPVGAETGMARVVRGGGDGSNPLGRPANRSGYAPAFDFFTREEIGNETKAGLDDNKQMPGLVGIYYASPDFERPRGWEILDDLDQDWGGKGARGNDWSGQWEGFLISPVNGEITFTIQSDYGVTLRIDTETIIDWKGQPGTESGSIRLEKERAYPVVLSYRYDHGDRAYLDVDWSWEGQPRTNIPPECLFHPVSFRQKKRRAAEGELGTFPPIGFRVVQAEEPDSEPVPVQQTFVLSCVVEKQPGVRQSPDPNKPWFRRRSLLPMPPDNVPRDEIRKAGFHPGMMNHNHSPALEVCPNGDVILVIYTSEHEYEPEVSLMMSRLRFGAETWDMPEIVFDFPDVNDHAPCLFTEKQRIFLFWGNPGMGYAYPFQWMTSDNNGADWSQVHFPQFINFVGHHSRQPINTVVRGLDETLYVSSDGEGGSSVLWATTDNGKFWMDTGGRSGGRHTTFTVLKDGSILGLGGKNTDIEGYMPKSVSTDGGKTWKVSKTPFAALGSNQRPCLIRLQSGRLFFCGDFQHRNGHQPDDIHQRGSYVALSEDEGQTWHVKKLEGTLPHESDKRDDTIGYSVARQAPNGIIHLITTMNTPCLHFELNEAWILSNSAGWGEYRKEQIKHIREYQEVYPSGQVKTVLRGGITETGEYRLHGKQIWYYPDGRKQWEVNYNSGVKTGFETFWGKNGQIIWTWTHKKDGVGVWTQFWSDGNKRSESTWYNYVAEGISRCWDRTGKMIHQVQFSGGRIGE
jgi:formylglycine-generating enzyme required for sulfatase activity